MSSKASRGAMESAGRGSVKKRAQSAAGRHGRSSSRPGRARDTKEILGELKMLRSHCKELDQALARSRRANDEMRRTLASYRLLFADSLNPIFFINDKGEFLTVNNAALRFAECSLRELKKKKPWDLGPPDKREQHRKEFSDFKSRRTAEMDFLIKGRSKILLLNLLPVTIGRFSLLYVVGQDLTERKRTEQALRDSEANARALLDAPTDSIFLIDRSGMIYACNETGARLFGKTPQELVGTDGYQMMDRELGKRRGRWMEKMFDTGEPVRFQDERAGRHFDTVIFPVRDAAGKVVRAAVVSRDISDMNRAEQALRDSEATARALLNAPTDVIFLIDSVGRVFACNETAAKRFGRRQEELVGVSLPLLISPPWLRESRTRLVRQVFADGNPVRFQDEREGRCFDTVCYPIRDSAGNIVRVAIVARDITELELARRKLAEQEAALAEAQAIARLGSWERDIATGLERWSDEQYRLFGFEPGRAKPDLELFLSLVHPDDREKILRADEACARTKQPLTLDFRAVRPDGTVRWFRATTKVFCDDSGKPVRVAGTNLDITDTKLAEAAAQESDAVAKALFDSPTDAVFLITTDGTYIDCNEVAARQLGRTPAELRGKNRQEVAPVEEIAAQARRVETAIRTRMSFRYEIEVLGGTYDTVIYPIPDASGEITRVAVVARDITEFRRALQDRSDLREQLLHAQKLESLGILAGGIAHDFNNLLTSILGQADLALLTLPSDSPARSFLEEIVKTTRRAAGLTNQLLAYSGKGQFVTRVVDLGETVKDMANLLEVSVSGKVNLKLDVSPGAPGIEADVSQLRQVVMNLVMNASEALANGTGAVSVSVGARRFDKAFLSGDVLGQNLSPGTYVYLEVKDTGCGMKPELVEKAFDPFFSTKFSGRGLGLATVLGIVKAHDGAIRVDSVPGKGTTFTILFPPSHKPPEKEEERKERVPQMVGSGTILLVDDEDMVREPASRLLARLGFSVLTAVNGREALDVFRANRDKIECVILDLTMPEMSGEEAFQELRRMKSDLKIILSSGYGETESIRSFPGRGPDGFLQKPYQLKQLAAKLREVLGEGGVAVSN
jgi:PAS domain S-box-containing protein